MATANDAQHPHTALATTCMSLTVATTYVQIGAFLQANLYLLVLKPFIGLNNFLVNKMLIKAIFIIFFKFPLLKLGCADYSMAQSIRVYTVTFFCFQAVVEKTMYNTQMILCKTYLLMVDWMLVCYSSADQKVHVVDFHRCYLAALRAKN